MTHKTKRDRINDREKTEKKGQRLWKKPSVQRKFEG